MTSISRLESLLPRLADSFRNADPFKQRKAVIDATVFAVSHAGLEGHEVTAATEIIRDAVGEKKSALKAQLERLVGKFDDQYFELVDLDDENSKVTALHAFSKARAASALAFALSEEPDHLQEALYEAILAMNDSTEIVQIAEQALH